MLLTRAEGVTVLSGNRRASFRWMPVMTVTWRMPRDGWGDDGIEAKGTYRGVESGKLLLISPLSPPILVSSSTWNNEQIPLQRRHPCRHFHNTRKRMRQMERIPPRCPDPFHLKKRNREHTYTQLRSSCMLLTVMHRKVSMKSK
jgi:hypothetical protein